MIRMPILSRAVFTLAMVFAMMFGLLGCDKDKSSSSGSSGSGSSGTSSGSGGSAGGGGSQVSGLKGEAQDAVLAEIARHWLKGADGWTTARMIGTSFAADYYIRQIRELTVENVEAYDLNDADKLNGMEWAGEVAFKPSPAREAGDPGIAFDGVLGGNLNRRRGQWTQWVDFHPDAIRVHKAKGKWQVTQDNNVLRGTLPTAADFTKAGVR